MKRTIIITLFCVITGNFLLFAQHPVKPIKESIKDSAIIYPESMTENLSKLLSDWQIDLSKSDNECNNGLNVVFNDTVYAERLQALPSIMELSFNHVVRSYIERYTVRVRNQVSYMLALGDYYFPMFEQMLDKYDLPLELKYLPVIESALNPVAVSRVGATGLWQFMLRTGQGYGLEINSLVDERRDPYKSTEAAVRYLYDLYQIYGDWNLVIAAYNCGPGNVNKAIARSGGKKDYWEIYYFLPRETRGYVPAFAAANYIMNYYAEHNICPMESHRGLTALDTVHVNRQLHFEQIAGVLDISVSELNRLNPQFKKNVIPGGSKSYALVLPTDKMYKFIALQDSISNYQKTTYFANRTFTDNYLLGSSSGNSQNIYYRVRKGDNLSTIARRNGVSVNQLMSWNGLKSSRLSVGKQLIVGKRPVPKPSPSANLATTANDTSQNSDNSQKLTYKTENKYYRVRKGDTLGEIAKKNRVTVPQLQSWNGLKSTNIREGSSLIVNKIKVAVPAPPEVKTDTVSNPKSTESDGSIISNHLKEQMGSTEEPEPEENAETSKTNENIETEEAEAL